jgi:hypothetical protein
VGGVKCRGGFRRWKRVFAVPGIMEGMAYITRKVGMHRTKDVQLGMGGDYPTSLLTCCSTEDSHFRSSLLELPCKITPTLNHDISTCMHNSKIRDLTVFTQPRSL